MKTIRRIWLYLTRRRRPKYRAHRKQVELMGLNPATVLIDDVGRPRDTSGTVWAALVAVGQALSLKRQEAPHGYTCVCEPGATKRVKLASRRVGDLEQPTTHEVTVDFEVRHMDVKLLDDFLRGPGRKAMQATLRLGCGGPDA